MRTSLLVFALLVAGAARSETPKTLTLTIHRQPAEAVIAAGMKTDETMELPYRETGCQDVAALRAMDYSLAVRATANGVEVDVSGGVTLEKIAKGPSAAPTLVVEMKGESGSQSLSFALEKMMTSPHWDDGGTMREKLTSRDLLEAKFWTSAELRCSRTFPYRPALIPSNVVYKNGDAMAANFAASKLREALRGDHGLANPELYDDGMLIIGPGLFEALKGDSALEAIKSPKLMTIDPATGKAREGLRAKGKEELEAFVIALHRHLGTAQPRIRAATAEELGQHWLNIGWDIEEPIFVIDYGERRLVADYLHNTIMMLDELPPPSR